MRGRWRLPAAAFIGTAAACVLTVATSATVLPPSPNPLPGSSFQGADGDQDNAGTRIDWQAMQRAGRTYHVADPNASDTIFASSKENEPGEWSFDVQKDGATPPKSNILDGWAAVDQSGAEVFLYLGFAREDDNGTTYLAFELNHDPKLWFNGEATIPCRRTGDILVSYEAEGTDVEVVVQRWITETVDPSTMCARTGRIDEFSDLTANVDAQGAINDANITARLPGFYDDEVPRRRFGEAALNLSRILDGAFNRPCFSFGSIWMHSRSSTSSSSSMQDYVSPKPLSVRSCSASGTKFHDLNGNGRHDAREPGIPRYLIWADYDNDGVVDRIEPFGITDRDGQYVINGIRPRGTYMLRETIATRLGRLRAVAAGVVCSFPNDETRGGTGSAPGGLFGCAWGPIATATTTNARGRDFGNYAPPVLVLRKELAPPTDPGRFDLIVNGTVSVPAAGDGTRRALRLDPGTYVVSERAVPGTNAADYRSTIECKRGTHPRVLRSGSVFANLQLRSGQIVVCTFRNIRRGAPAIAIDKVGPAAAPAGSTLRYRLYVTNPGDLPFPAASVRVTDDACDDPPVLVGKARSTGADTTPRTLDPGDTWIYRCSRKTAPPGPGCRTRSVANTGTATGTAAGASVSDMSTISTALLCPPPPPLPTPLPPPPLPPEPVVPPGPRPPDAGDAAGAAFRALRARGCLRSRTPRLSFQGTRIASVRIYVDGSLRRSLDVSRLQRTVSRRIRLLPGRRYRVAARVAFERGSGTPPVTLTRRLRVCPFARVRSVPFTG
jgi:hypothetical protein